MLILHTLYYHNKQHFIVLSVFINVPWKNEYLSESTYSGMFVQMRWVSQQLESQKESDNVAKLDWRDYIKGVN